GSLSICPSGDKDNYSIQIVTANQNLEMDIEYDTAGADLQGAILNSGGITINAATLMGAGVKHAAVPNLPVGTYYASVWAPTSGRLKTNKYTLELHVTGP